MIAYSYDFLNDNFYDEMSMDCELFHRVFSAICCVTPTNIPVLISGENGMWKSSIARMIHKNSRRKYGRLLTVDCGNPDANALEIELFGHEQEDHHAIQRIGKIEQARGGSILLREIGMAPSAIQARLLQVTQAQEFYRVGGTKIIYTDVRIIATTSKELEFAVKAGRFREDLFYRLAVFQIHIPPLRDFRKDIKFLANYFLKVIARRNGKPIIGISDDAMNLLIGYDWPGNIEELKETIEYAVGVEKFRELQSKSLPKKVRSVRELKPTLQLGDQENDIVSLEDIERQSQ